MREFQDYTKASRVVRWRRLLWSVSIGLAVAALVVVIGVRAGAMSTPLETLGYGADTESGEDGASHGGWLRVLLGGSDEITDGPLNVLVLGVDKRPPGSKEAQVAGVRTDTVMLVQVVPGTGEIKLLSVPRDFLVEIEPGVKDKINAAYSYGGIEQTMGALQNYTQIPIERYVIVDFRGFRHVINAIGGVEVDVEDEIPPKYGIKDGLQTLNGAQALFYARYRGTAGGDLDRIEHQQRLIAALRSKAFGWDTVTKLPHIARVMNRNVETNLEVNEALTLSRILISRGRNAQMTVAQLEGTPKTLPNGEEVLVPNDAANEASLAEFRY
jgi:polyisoprenyl-teichoic acid--peptidoglycan teichoic acid transferase